jgi:hypothetical protein
MSNGYPNYENRTKMKEESLFQKVLIGIIFIAFLVFWMWVPDFTLDEEDCAKQSTSAYVGKLCSESKAK